MSEKPDNVYYGFTELRANREAQKRRSAESKEQTVTLREVAENIVEHVDHALMIAEVLKKMEAEDPALRMGGNAALDQAEALLSKQQRSYAVMLGHGDVHDVEKLLRLHLSAPEHFNKVYLNAIAKRYLELTAEVPPPTTAA